MFSLGVIEIILFSRRYGSPLQYSFCLITPGRVFGGAAAYGVMLSRTPLKNGKAAAVFLSTGVFNYFRVNIVYQSLEQFDYLNNIPGYGGRYHPVAESVEQLKNLSNKWKEQMKELAPAQHLRTTASGPITAWQDGNGGKQAALLGVPESSWMVTAVVN